MYGRDAYLQTHSQSSLLKKPEARGEATDFWFLTFWWSSKIVQKREMCLGDETRTQLVRRNKASGAFPNSADTESERQCAGSLKVATAPFLRETDYFTWIPCPPKRSCCQSALLTNCRRRTEGAISGSTKKLNPRALMIPLTSSAIQEAS